MIAREIGEYPGREGQSVQPPLVQAVGGRFHGDMGDPPLHHGRERGLQIDRTRGGQRAGGGGIGSPVPIKGPRVPMLPAVSRWLKR